MPLDHQKNVGNSCFLALGTQALLSAPRASCVARPLQGVGRSMYMHARPYVSQKSLALRKLRPGLLCHDNDHYSHYNSSHLLLQNDCED